ncbi:calpain-7 [Holotrichia oblita]|uniref:Calpain-7 n=1 Tax=Holotrichia oblita TaxID=644536 RepID=A0ACB9SSE3_HOLOL|nr:calpain-7 [Holotrichia oblita]
MCAPSQYLEDAISYARRAVEFDRDGQIDPAIYFYSVSSKLLLKAAGECPERQESLLAKSKEYNARATALEESKNKPAVDYKDESKQKQKRYKFLMQQALDADAAGLKDTAVGLYTDAIEFVTQNPELMQGELKELAIKALERAETLKGIKPKADDSPTQPIRQPLIPIKNVPSLHRGTSFNLKVTGSDTYSQEEKQVLFHTSKINNNEFVPFMNIDLSEKFQFAIPFSDRDGHLALSPKQQRDFHKWVRPDEICREPSILYGDYPNYFSIKQTIVSDCSFVASLAVSASYEKRFGKKLVTAIIYPRSKDKKPLYNPFGKYMIKLHLNGVTRKIIIDDYLPMSRYGQLLCSYSSNKNEFWISLLEKAYMKVMGGYDFPGSNSNIDLHALTGWIPERVAIRTTDKDFNKNALFNSLETRMAKGDVLVSVATGEMSDSEAERTGLVATHAYAVMDVRTVNGVQLLQLKNPWSHLRWKGNYSELDIRHWTPELQRLLNYDPNSAAQFDNGVFWIDYESICAFFDVFYMNWNTELFKFTYCIHESWKAGSGPTKDLYTFGSNPQYSLDVGPDTTGAVWVLLTRHIMDIADFRENREYITVLVYKGGKRVYYPHDPPPYIDGVRINSPHYLCKIILGPGSARKYTLVVSQYEKTATIYYTLRAYATCPFSLTKIGDPYRCTKEISGEWKGVTAGGCGNNPQTYKNNPKIRLEIESPRNDNSLFVELKGPKQYQIGFDVTITSLADESVTAPFKTTSSGAFRSGYVILDLENIPAGVLHIIPSTFLPNQEGPFIMTVKCSAQFQLVRER